MNSKIREAIGIHAPLNPQNITANTNGAEVLLTQRRRALAVVMLGAITGTGNVTVKLQRSPDGTTWADIAGKSVTLTTANTQAAIEVAGEEIANVANRIRYRIELGTGVTGAQVSGCVLVGDLRYEPATHASTVTAIG